MDNEKERFERFLHNNMPEEPFDPDKVLAAVCGDMPNYQPSEKFIKGMEKLLRQSKKQERIRRAKNFFLGKGVARFAVAMSLMLCTVLVVQANNGAIFDLFFQTHQSHTGIQLTEQIRQELLADKLNGVDIPVYFPRYLPEGYTITDVKVFSQKITFQLTKDSYFISISQCALNEYNGKIGVDSEGAPLEKLTVNGQEAFYKVKEDALCLYFFDNYNYYKIIGNSLSKKEIIRIAESLEMVVGF